MKHYLQFTQTTLYTFEMDAENGAAAQLALHKQLGDRFYAKDLEPYKPRIWAQPLQISMITPDDYLTDKARA